jgi:hypothetical protein
MDDHHLCYTIKLRKRTQNQPEENSKNRVSPSFSPKHFSIIRNNLPHITDLLYIHPYILKKEKRKFMKLNLNSKISKCPVINV